MKSEMRVRLVARSVRRLAGHLLLASATASMIGSPATARITASLVETSFGTTFYSKPALGPDGTVDARAGVTGSGIAFVGAARLSPDEIYFKNGVINASLFELVSMTTGVAVTFFNDHDFSYSPGLHSTLLAAGMGITLVDVRYPDGATTTDCTHTQLKNCGAIDLTRASTYGSGFEASIMRTTSAGFDFDVRLEGAADPLYSLSSRIGYDSGGNYYEDTAAAELALDNFQKVIDSTYSHAFTWDDTGVDIETGVTINPGESVTVIFTTTSIAYAVDASGFAFTDWSDPLNPYSNQVQTLVYASFGDPTGGKGGGGRRLAFSGASDPGLDGVNTNDFAVFEVPTEEVDEVNRTVIGSLVGKTTFLPKSEFPYGRPAGAVPEPASWAMMIAGLGLVGGVLRRRQPAPHSRHPIG